MRPVDQSRESGISPNACYEPTDGIDEGWDTRSSRWGGDGMPLVTPSQTRNRRTALPGMTRSWTGVNISRATRKFR